MPDIVRIGGFARLLRAAALAEAAGIPTSNHLFIEASTHALTARPNAHYLEFMDICSSLIQTSYELREGCLAPLGPGFGIAWNQKAVQASLA